MKKKIITTILLFIGLFNCALSWGQTITPSSGTYCTGTWVTYEIDEATFVEYENWSWSNGSTGQRVSYLCDGSSSEMEIVARGTKTIDAITYGLTDCSSCEGAGDACTEESATNFTCTRSTITSIELTATASVLLKPTTPIFSESTTNVACGAQIALTYSVEPDPEVVKYGWSYAPWTEQAYSTSNSIKLYTSPYDAPLIVVFAESKDCPGLISDAATIKINRKPLAPILDEANSPVSGTIIRSSSDEYTFTILPSEGANSYSWACASPIQNHIGIGNNTGTSVNWVFPQSGKGNFIVLPHSACGDGAPALIKFDVIPIKLKF